MVKKWLGRPYSDWVGVALGGLVAWWIGGRDWLSFMTQLDVDARRGVYQTFAGIAAGLLGFFIATVAILLGVIADRPRMRAALGEGRGRRIHAFFFAGIRAVSLTMIVFALMLLLDQRAVAAKWVEPLLLGSTLLILLRTSRIVWILNKIVTIAVRDQEES